MKVDRKYETSQREKYLESVSRSKVYDEVWPIIRLDPDAAKWIERIKHLSHQTVHHIHGRGAAKRYHWFCNLIVVSQAVHQWGHDVSPACFELACLRAKMRSEAKRIKNGFPKHPEESKWVWNPEVMSANIDRDTLSGRIDELRAKIQKPIGLFHQIANELQEFIATPCC